MTHKSRITAGFLASLLLLETIVRILSPVLGPPLTAWNTMEQVKSMKLNDMLAAGKKIDFLFMGNSTTWIGINPSTIDSDLKHQTMSFNAAMNGSTSLSIGTYASEYIIPKSHPSNLIVLFSQGGLRTSENNSNFTKTSSTAKTLSKYSYLFRYRNTLRDPMTLNTFRRSIEFSSLHEGIVYRWARDVTSNGYSVFPQSPSVMSSSGWDLKKVNPTSNPIISVPKTGLKDMLLLNQIAKHYGTRLVIGTVPTLEFDPNYRATIEKLAREVGVPFIQGNDAATDGMYFQDGVHLNAAGAELFSHFMAKQLSKLP